MAITGKGGRPSGLPKSGGRQKGTPNGATLTATEKLDAHKYINCYVEQSIFIYFRNLESSGVDQPATQSRN
jgi:hypothetical protein